MDRPRDAHHAGSQTGANDPSANGLQLATRAARVNDLGTASRLPVSDLPARP